MRVSQGKREQYAVHFVSANKHAIVLSNVYRTIYTISDTHVCLFFGISENMLNIWRGDNTAQRLYLR